MQRSADSEASHIPKLILLIPAQYSQFARFVMWHELATGSVRCRAPQPSQLVTQHHGPIVCVAASLGASPQAAGCWGEHPIAPVLVSKHSALMKHHQSALNSRLPEAAHSAAVADPKTVNPISAPTQADVARRAYFAYINEDSPPGRDLKHWLETEVQLHAEIIRGNGPHAGS